VTKKAPNVPNDWESLMDDQAYQTLDALRLRKEKALAKLVREIEGLKNLLKHAYPHGKEDPRQGKIPL